MTYKAAVYKCDRCLAVEEFTSYKAVMAFSNAMTYNGYTTYVEDEKGNDLSNNSINYHRNRKRDILMTIGVWAKMTEVERNEFDSAIVLDSKGKVDEEKTKELIDRLQVKFRRMYF